MPHPPRRNHPRRRTADVHELAANMPEHLSAAVHLAVWSGLRASELFALDRSRVDLDAGSLRVDRSQIVIRGKFHGYGPPKSDAGNRVVHIPPHVVAMLRDHIRDHTRPGRAALIFARPDTGGPIVDPVRTRAFAKARAAIGRPELRWHDLRHSGATLAAHAGATPRELQHRFGHATAAAASIYQHATAQRDRELAHRMAGYAAEPPPVSRPSTTRNAGAADAHHWQRVRSAIRRHNSAGDGWQICGNGTPRRR
ncbi:site-specific integrase [Rhodococcus sp. (in: high G+C Gram-positive bacteria)]|uniref:site-specific integrase n=1 Tax=Rhodococcus sp. TaxID=1831 RepID=UPI001A29AA28|nr:site-specific integrase [Rhodococcus sp. (in: high G+C Gram-positive bacteria)]MBJ7480460.1 site-specific integrase [Rhodococcus sp. (in: high G+C Gram-positive bacteria)]